MLGERNIKIQRALSETTGAIVAFLSPVSKARAVVWHARLSFFSSHSIDVNRSTLDAMAKTPVPPPSALAALLPALPPQLLAIVEKLIKHGEQCIAWVLEQEFKTMCVYAVLLVITYTLVDFLLSPSVPTIDVKLTDQDRTGIPGKKWKVGTKFPADKIPCYDPGTLEMLGPDMKAMDADEVKTMIKKAKVAQQQWKKSSWKQRRLLLKVIARFILDNQDDICKVSARDSGKPLVDAAFGEILVTLEKIKWLLRDGEKWLSPEQRSPGLMMFYKKATVEYHPVGVMGAIVPVRFGFFLPVPRLFVHTRRCTLISRHPLTSNLRRVLSTRVV